MSNRTTTQESGVRVLWILGVAMGKNTVAEGVNEPEPRGLISSFSLPNMGCGELGGDVLGVA